MPLTATPITDRAIGAPKLEEAFGGLRGQRKYRVNTHDEYAALFMAPVPQYAAPWSVELTSCRVVHRGTEYEAKKDKTQTTSEPTTGGSTIVTVDYETPGFRGTPPPEPNLTYSMIEPGVESIQVYATLDPVPNAIPRGAPKKVGVTRIIVYKYFGPSDPIDIARMNDLAYIQAVNEDGLVFPKFLGTNISYAIGAGKAQFENFALAPRNGTVELRMTFVLAPGFDWFWSPENAKGEPLLFQDSGPIYQTANLAGLW